MRKALIILGVYLTFFAQTFSVSAATYEYDDLDRVTEVIYEDGTSVTYFYDANGNLVETRVEGTNEKDSSQTGEVPTKEVAAKGEQTGSRDSYAAELDDNEEQNERGKTGIAGGSQNDTLQNSDGISDELNNTAEGEKAQQQNNSENQGGKNLFAAGGAAVGVLAAVIIVIAGVKRKKRGNEE